MPAEPGDLRLFFALWPQPAVRGALCRATAGLVRAAGGRPVARENLHLTLAFLPRVPTGLVGDLVQLGDALPVPPLRLVLDRPGWFSRARVLWLAPADPPDALPRFRRALWRRLAPRVAPADDGERFVPHVTLARRVARLPEVPVEPVTWPVERWALVASEAADGGARYRVLADWPVPGPAEPKARVPR